MHALEMHAAAQRVYAEVLLRVTDADLSRPTPCPDWNVAALIEHVLIGNQWVVELAGRTPAGVHGTRIEAHLVSAEQAHAVFDDPHGLTRRFELPFGSMPGETFAAIRAGDIYTHAWDLARSIGQPTDLDRELGEAVYAATAPFLGPELRGPGRPFGEARPCDPARPIADRLAALLGRTV